MTTTPLPNGHTPDEEQVHGPLREQPGQAPPVHGDIDPERPETRIPRVGTSTGEEEE